VTPVAGTEVSDRRFVFLVQHFTPRAGRRQRVAGAAAAAPRSMRLQHRFELAV